VISACQQCGVAFRTYPSVERKFCSRKCYEAVWVKGTPYTAIRGVEELLEPTTVGKTC
jgi:protein-arginine kinase activator protein McsA